LVTRFILPDTMPMDARAVVGQVVVDCDFEPISPIGSDNWSWVLIVDQHDHSLPSTVKIGRSVCDSQSIWNSFSGVRPLLVKVGCDRESTTLEKLV
jgi:hypothetical protein